jgi:hypothetical protein
MTEANRFSFGGNMPTEVRSCFVAACGCAFALLTAPALATMPNPNTTPWVDHSKPIKPGVDISPQHFASFEVQPRGKGQFDIQWTCENGMRGSRNDARYVAAFLQGDALLESLAYMTVTLVGLRFSSASGGTFLPSTT